MSTTKTFHSDFQRVTVMVGGTPVSINAEVDVTIKQPTKLDDASRAGWDMLKATKQLAVTVEGTPSAGGA